MGQLIRQLALVSEVDAIKASELSRVSAALQKQVTRDFQPIWDVVATVDAFPELEDVPIGYWPIVVRDDIGYQGAAGIHLDEDGQPFALVQYGDLWSLTASHEVLEMLADPFGNRIVAGDSIKEDQGRVEYLLEVSDPSEDARFAYRVNGVPVSDFYTPDFFAPVAAPGVRYSYTGAITSPRQIREGGYLSWRDPSTNEWWQQRWFDTARPTFHSLGVFHAQASLRSEIDKRTPHALQLAKKAAPNTLAAAFVAAAATKGSAMDQAAATKAGQLKKQIVIIRTAAQKAATGR